MRLETPRGLEPLFGVAPGFGRIDTLRCSEARSRGVFGGRDFEPNKHERGGREPNGRAGRPRRGKRSGEHRLDRNPNRMRNECGRSVGAKL
jgi:hypothetical protein